MFVGGASGSGTPAASAVVDKIAAEKAAKLTQAQGVVAQSLAKIERGEPLTPEECLVFIAHCKASFRAEGSAAFGAGAPRAFDFPIVRVVPGEVGYASEAHSLAYELAAEGIGPTVRSLYWEPAFTMTNPACLEVVAQFPSLPQVRVYCHHLPSTVAGWGELELDATFLPGHAVDIMMSDTHAHFGPLVIPMVIGGQIKVPAGFAREAARVFRLLERGMEKFAATYSTHYEDFCTLMAQISSGPRPGQLGANGDFTGDRNEEMCDAKTCAYLAQLDSMGRLGDLIIGNHDIEGILSMLAILAAATLTPQENAECDAKKEDGGFGGDEYWSDRLGVLFPAAPDVPGDRGEDIYSFFFLEPSVRRSAHTSHLGYEHMTDAQRTRYQNHIRIVLNKTVFGIVRDGVFATHASCSKETLAVAVHVMSEALAGREVPCRVEWGERVEGLPLYVFMRTQFPALLQQPAVELLGTINTVWKTLLAPVLDPSTAPAKLRQDCHRIIKLLRHPVIRLLVWSDPNIDDIHRRLGGGGLSGLDELCPELFSAHATSVVSDVGGPLVHVVGHSPAADVFDNSFPPRAPLDSVAGKPIWGGRGGACMEGARPFMAFSRAVS